MSPSEISIFDYKPQRAKPTPRTLHFQQIVDSRFDGDDNSLKPLLEKRTNLIIEKLRELPNIKVETGDYHKLTWGEPEPGSQWRIDFYINKDSSITWDTIYHIVNSVKPAHYEFIQHNINCNKGEA